MIQLDIAPCNPANKHLDLSASQIRKVVSEYSSWKKFLKIQPVVVKSQLLFVLENVTKFFSKLEFYIWRLAQHSQVVFKLVIESWNFHIMEPS